MANYLSAFALTMGHEGAYANNPLDTGGETYKGIARNFNPAWSGWVIVDAVTKKTKNVTEINATLGRNADLQSNVQSFYKKAYWDVNRLDAIQDERLAKELFDTGVNAGPTKAAKLLQEALNLTNLNERSYPNILVDGKIGPLTITYANQHPRAALLLKVLNGLQAEHYINIMRAKPNQEVFANTWFSRVTI